MRTQTIGYGLLILAMALLTACLSGGVIRGTVTGLTGTGLVLGYKAYLAHPSGTATLVGSDTLGISENGNFAFKTPLPALVSGYSVYIVSQPSGQVCLINESGNNNPAEFSVVHGVQCMASTEFKLHAGSVNLEGSADGIGAAAKFTYPNGIALDSVGNTYVADTFNGTIRKITPDGTVTTLAGSVGNHGHVDGTGDVARFDYPRGIALDKAGNIYVNDNHTVRKISPAGEVITLAGKAGVSGFFDGTAAHARFGDQVGIAVDSMGYVHVAESRTVRKISPEGVVTTLAGSVLSSEASSVDGTGMWAKFARISGIAIDSANNAYVTDYISIRKITPAGVVTTLAGSSRWSNDIADGSGADAKFRDPTNGIAVDGADNIYVTDGKNNYVRKISPQGLVTTIAAVSSSIGAGIAVSADKIFIISGNSVLGAPKP